MNNLLGTSALIAVGTLAALMPVRPARAQQGFNSGGLNTCSIIYNQNLQAISTCYGYINGVPEFFTQQPSGSALPLQFDNFVGLVGHTPAPISISTSGSVTIAGGINFGGTINVGLPGILWNLPNPHFTGQTTSQTPLWNVQALTVNGTLGCGTLCARAPEYDIQSENIKDTIVMNNGAFTANHHNFYFFGPSSGGKIDAIFDMRQAGPLTPDVTLNTHGQNVQKQTSIGVFNPWLSINDTAGGSIDGSGLIHPFGLAYGGNPKVTLAGAGSGRPGAAMWAAVVANGEVDIGIEPSQNTIIATGSVTVGDTLNVAIGSATNPGFGTVTVSTVAIAGDTLGLLVQKLCGQIKFNTTLNFNGVGAGCYGATDTLNSQLNISWPLTSIIGTGGSTDVTITPSVTGAGTEILTLGTAVPGASARLKTAQSIVQLKLDGSNGYGNDTVWYFAKQSNGAGWSSGGWRSIWEIGGGGSAPFDDVNSQDIEPSSWPMRFDADLIMFLAQTNVSGAPDAPAQNMQLHSVVDARNIDFLTAGGGPVLSPGYQLWGNGDQTVGSGTLSRLTGNAAAAGVLLSANGWEGTTVALVSGGGSNCGTADPTCLEHRYYKGDICEDAVNGVYQVDSTGTIGNVLTFHPVVTGTHTGYPSAAAGSVPATNQPVIGCSGTGWVNGITWTAGNTVRIGGVGQTVDIQGTISGSGASVVATGSTTARTLSDRAAGVVNIMDYGAKCDGTTNDNTAINAALAAAAASPAYAAGYGVHITGSNGTAKNTSSANVTGCVANSLNFTIFNTATGATSGARVEVSDMTILCTGTGNICADLTNARMVHMHDVSIVGNSSTPPEICIQTGISTAATSAAWHTFDRVNCGGNYAFTALYNVGSEANNYKDSFFANNLSTKGPIGNLGGIAAGSAYTPGTYTSQALTGGTGSGALATVVVGGGGTVTSVTITYAGRDYIAADTLSATLPAGSGFSVPVSTVTPYAAVIDGANHWRAASAFTSVTLPVDTLTSLTLLKFDGANIRGQGSRGAMWITGTDGLMMENTYVLSFLGSSCIDLYDGGWAHSGLNLGANCEAPSATSMFFMTGPTGAQSYKATQWRGYSLAFGNLFALDSTVSSLDFPGLAITAGAITRDVPMFSSAKLVAGSGQIYVPNIEQWNSPSFQGQITSGDISTPAGIGPVDILGSAAIALSCSRQLRRGYTGALCQVQRTSDSATLDIYPDGFGIAGSGSARAFCAGTTCGVSIAYDQSGNGNNAVQATAANQPTFDPGAAGFSGKPGMLWNTAAALSVSAAASINDIFAAGGYMTSAVFQSSNALPNRLWAKISGSGGASPGLGIDFRVNSAGGNPITVDVGATTSNGVWTTSAALSNAGHVYDMQYSTTSVANSPTIGVDGTVLALGTTAPVGTISTDAAQDLLIGNNIAIGVNRGFIGTIGEIIFWKTTPSATRLEAIRRNEAVFYSISGVN